MNKFLLLILLFIYSVNVQSQEVKTEEIDHASYGKAIAESYYDRTGILRKKRIFTRDPAFTKEHSEIGELFIYSEKGNLYAQGPFYTSVEDKGFLGAPLIKFGEWSLYKDESSTVIGKYFFENNEEHGKFTRYHDQGRILEEGRYEKGVKTGLNRIYFQNGQLHRVIEYKEGNVNNVVEFYNIDGDAIDFGTLKNANGTLKLFNLANGSYDKTFTYENGTPNIIEIKTIETKKGQIEEKIYKTNSGSILKIVRPLDGQLEGLQQSMGYRGNVEESINYKNGVKNGRYEIYHFNGSLKEIGFYKNGKLSGLRSGYHDNGKDFYQDTYKDGIKTGPFKMFHYSDGFMVEEGSYDDNEKLTGQHNSYFGKERYLFASGKFLENNKVGVWRQYSRTGILKSETNYFDLGSNKQHSKEFYIVDGKPILKSEATYINRVIDGKFKTFHPNGVLKEAGEYKNGDRVDGKFKVFHPNGKVKKTGQYKNGRSTGIWRYYNEEGEKVSEEKYIDNE